MPSGCIGPVQNMHSFITCPAFHQVDIFAQRSHKSKCMTARLEATGPVTFSVAKLEAAGPASLICLRAKTNGKLRQEKN
eukprot:1139138-Pelagomonas_calceolata.AAC.6